jgi:hypothetical protein
MGASRLVVAMLIAVLLGSSLAPADGVLDDQKKATKKQLAGEYLELSTADLLAYDEATESLYATGKKEGKLCITDAESRKMLAGVCVDVDALAAPDAGYDAQGLVKLAGEWALDTELSVNGKEVPHCVPVCFGDAILGLTFLSWQVTNDDVCDGFSHGSILTVVASIQATDGDMTISAFDAATVPCDP